MNKIFPLVIGSLLSFALVQAAMAATYAEEVAARIQKVGDVCVEGEDCASATATTQVAAAGSFDPKEVYDRSCATCHAIGVAGAPKFADEDAWAPRIEKGMDVLYSSVLNGLPPGMPAKGMCFTCSDEELKEVTDYMVSSAQ